TDKEVRSEYHRIRGTSARGTVLGGRPRERGLPATAQPTAAVRLPHDRALPCLVPDLRRAGGLRARLHGHQGRRQHQHRSDLRPAAVRVDVRDHGPLHPLRQPQARPDRRPDQEEHGRGRVVTTLAQSIEGNNPVLNITIFALFVIVTLVVVFRASRNTKTASDYYAAGRSFSGPQNGTAIAGDYLSAASFLGIAGAIAVYGYDGFLYSIGFLVAWLVALLLVAELLRNTGKFTMGDVLAFRMRQRPVRAAAATSTMAVSFFYLLAQ